MIQVAQQVNALLQQHTRLVVTAPPGAGKSTLLPLHILDAMAPTDGRIVMLEPRRLAARQIAERMACLRGEKVGETVGYRVRLESRVSAQTRIEVITEGILTRMLIDDPTLDGVGLVIFDEVHERSLQTDVALALTLEAQQVIRPDVRIVLMSATIDATALCQGLGAQLVQAQGRLYPIETIYHPIQTQPGPAMQQQLCQEVAHVVRLAHHEHEGDVLVFMPGEAEIRQCAELLSGGVLGQTHICPLYGMLPMQQQQQAIAPSRKGERKVVLATSIAETSLTIEGVRVVIDAGLCRRMVFVQSSGLSQLQTQSISLDMADQRRGRAGRVAPGICYRLWSLATEHRMAACRMPEILDADLAPTVLDIAAWGESHPERLPWLTPPPPAHLAQARQLLQLLGAIDTQGRITAHGRRLSSLPCHPRIAQMLLSAPDDTARAMAADIAALLDERDPLASTLTDDADLNTRLAELRRQRERGHGQGVWARIISTAQQYRRLVHCAESNEMASALLTGQLLAAAYPERIAQAYDDTCGRYRMANGESFTLPLTDALTSHTYLVAASLNSGRLFLGSPVSIESLRPLAQRTEHIAWDARQQQLITRQEWRLGSLVIESRPLHMGHDAQAAETMRQLMLDALCQAVPKQGTTMFDFSDQVGQLQRRVATVAQWHPELNLPDLSTEWVLTHAHEWLPNSLMGQRIPTNVSELRRLPLHEALWMLLSYEQQQTVNELAPTHITVPTGSRIRVEYRQGAELPILRVRLQECFGLIDTPRVDNGQRPILLELLSPGFKPVQLTQDLRSFWQNTYYEVRKELRRRYPKHSWPDDPLQAEAVRGVKRG